MNDVLLIAIAEPSAIIRSGLEMILKRVSGSHFRLIEAVSAEALPDLLRLHKPDILVINPCLSEGARLQHLKEDTGCPEMKCVALLHQLMDASLLRPYDEQLSIYDSPDEIRHKLERLYSESVVVEEDDDQQALSSREKEIVVCVVKGMTNREIADHLFLSAHTVITHRRNIARKLQIHSPSGLTIYAIVNKLVELEDIRQ